MRTKAPTFAGSKRAARHALQRAAHSARRPPSAKDHNNLGPEESHRRLLEPDVDRHGDDVGQDEQPHDQRDDGGEESASGCFTKRRSAVNTMYG